MRKACIWNIIWVSSWKNLFMVYGNKKAQISLLISICRVHKSRWKCVWPSLVKWFNYVWNFRIFLPEWMNFYQTWSDSPAHFKKTDLCSMINIIVGLCLDSLTELPHNKTNKMTVHPAKTQISLGIRLVWSESSLCAQWVAKDTSFLHADRSLATHWVHSEDSDQIGRMPRLIRVFAGC